MVIFVVIDFYGDGKKKYQPYIQQNKDNLS